MKTIPERPKEDPEVCMRTISHNTTLWRTSLHCSFLYRMIPIQFHETTVS